MGITELTVKSALHHLKRRGLPYKYDLNIYRGCTHGCKYCYAVKSHGYLGSTNYDSEIFIKTNIAEQLEKELSSTRWKKEIINIGGVCDSYQSIEEKYKIMREVLKIMIKYKNPVIISTKSSLIMRDLDLIDELASHTYVNIALCITSANDDLSGRVEPGASLPKERMRVLAEAGKTKASTGFHLMPILPFLADDKCTLETLVSWAAESRADYMLTGILYLTAGIKPRFLAFIKEYYPEFYQGYCDLYTHGGAEKNYKSSIHNYLSEMRLKYHVNNQYVKFIPRTFK